jgi:hypothetical protein
MILAGQWLGAPSYVNSAQAQLSTDPGRDRMQMIDQLKSMDSKLDKLVSILSSGELQVKVVQPDDNKGKANGR